MIRPTASRLIRRKWISGFVPRPFASIYKPANLILIQSFNLLPKNTPMSLFCRRMLGFLLDNFMDAYFPTTFALVVQPFNKSYIKPRKFYFRRVKWHFLARRPGSFFMDPISHEYLSKIFSNETFGMWELCCLWWHYYWFMSKSTRRKIWPE